MPDPTYLLTRRRQRRDGTLDPLNTDTRPRANPGGDPVIEAAGETTIYPDRTDFLAGPSTDGTAHVPHGVTKWVMRGNAQFHKFAAIARNEIKDLSARAYARTDAADDQTRRRDELKDTWTEARTRASFVHKVLDPLVLHHGRGELLRYVTTWALLICGDVAAGTLVLVYAGEHPLYAAIMMAALGAAAVTTGMLGKDLRRRNLWLSVFRSLPENEDARPLVTKVFAVADPGWQNTITIVKVAVAGAACLAAGTLLFRSTVDNAPAGIAYGLWAVAIGAASFWNGWTHLDPADTAIQNADDASKEAHKAYTSAPTDAIEARAASLAGGAEILAARCDDAWAAWYTCLAAAAEYLRVNPALAGHGTIGLSYLHSLCPADADLFDQIVDHFQIPRYQATRRFPGADFDAPRANDDPGAVIDLTASLNQRPTEASDPFATGNVTDGVRDLDAPDTAEATGL